MRLRYGCSCRGTDRASTPQGGWHCCRPISATSTLSTPIGTYPSRPSSSSSWQPASTAGLEVVSDERPGPDTGGVLGGPVDDPTRGEPEHPRLVSRHLPPPVALRGRAERQAPLGSRLLGPRRAAHRRLPRALGGGAAQQRSDP